MKRYSVLMLLLALIMGCSTGTKPEVRSSTDPLPANNLLTDTPEPINVVPSGWISFDSKQDGIWGIYLIKADGSGKAQPLTVHQKGEYWSAWSPDGLKLAFSSYRDSNGSSDTSAIYIINLDGTGFKQVTDGVAKDTMPAWSPDGKVIAFTSNRDAGNTDIYIVKEDGTGLKRLTDDPAGDIWPSWSPDGRKIAFVSQRSGNWQVHVMNVDGTNVFQLTDNSINANSAWSPDGKEIAFISGRDGNQDIYVMDIDGNNVKRLTNDPGKDDYPTWSPDSQFIAFVSDRAGNRDIYIMRRDGSYEMRITDEPTDEYPPKWSPANVIVSTEPRFGLPFCLRDTDNDGLADTSTKEYLQSDQAFFVSFPYANMYKDLAWNALLIPEVENSIKYSPIGYSATWNSEESGIMTLRLNNMVSFEITGFGHGVGIGPVPPGPIKLQLFIEDNLVQEIECEVIPSDAEEAVNNDNEIATPIPKVQNTSIPSSFPEGWYDGADGSVNASTCSVFGWTFDPDDEDRDVEVRILSDGKQVATTSTNILRADVGVCKGGTCGFNVDLWGLVFAGKNHLINAEAYDTETSTWVNLSGSPKKLTCWGYPEGTYDGEVGRVDANRCSVFGWVVDPDDRKRDVQVRILSDGNQVATTTANLLRRDVKACSGGSCGFHVKLWGLISSGEAHFISIEVFDEETNQWLELESSPKSMTCFSND